ncbi:MAG: response regulator [Geobacteraceae bacterium]|nr:response regulator [Geobacteraceae bacterium]
MTLRILLAEDNENLAQILARFIESRGDTVVRAATGTQTVRELAKGDIDLLLLDLGLPEISGVEILQKIRKSSKLASLPVIIITGVYKGDKYATAALKLGVQHYLEKPFGRETLEAALNETAKEINSGQQPSLLNRLLLIYNAKKSGLLTIGNLSPITFVKGEPSSFLAKGKKDFPEFLLAKGSIAIDDMQAFLESGEERIFFTESGILSFDELATESQLYLTKLLTENLSKSEGITFEENSGSEVHPLLHLSIPKAVYDAVKIFPEQFQAENFISKNSALFPARTCLFYRRANLIAMRETDILTLEKINGQRTVAELLKESGATQEPALFINFLHLMGMIALNKSPGDEASPDFHLKTLFNRPIEESRIMEDLVIDFTDIVEEVADNVVSAMGSSGMAAPLSEQEISFEQAVQREFALVKDKDYYAIFGMTPAKFSFNTLKEAYFAKTREYSPERFMELSGSTSAKAQEILSIYADAYNTLSNVVAKERYDEMLNDNMTMGIDGKQDGKLHARIQFQSGKVFLDMGEYENAEKALQEAYTLEPDNSSHAAFLAWAIYNNSSNSKSRAALDKARSLLSKSLQIEKIPEAFAFRGWMLYDEGRDGLAEGEFAKALRINQKEPTALKGMKLLNEKRESEKKGVFRRLFN